MGMSTYVVGIRPPGDKWKQMKAIYDACSVAGISLPEAVEEFFNFERPDDKGVIVELKECSQEYYHENEKGFEVDLSKLPKDIDIIRFYNSW